MKNLTMAFIFLAGAALSAEELNYTPEACKDAPPVMKANEAGTIYDAAMKEMDETFMKTLREKNRPAAFLVAFSRDLIVYKANKSAQKVFDEGESRGLASNETQRLLGFCTKLAGYAENFPKAAKSFITPENKEAKTP